jgi:hypothetical protein
LLANEVPDHRSPWSDWWFFRWVIGSCKNDAIGTDIIARMLHDYMKCELLALKAIPGFNINSMSYEMLGPVFDNDYGVMFSFKHEDFLDLEYNPTKWENS